MVCFPVFVGVVGCPWDTPLGSVEEYDSVRIGKKGSAIHKVIIKYTCAQFKSIFKYDNMYLMQFFVKGPLPVLVLR
jgi:hypothetical protein